MVFKTHTGETVTGQRLQYALDAVAHDYLKLARDIREEDAYAPHVTEEQKNKNMNDMFKHAHAVQDGSIFSFTDWQRVNEKLTGESIAFLP